MSAVPRTIATDYSEKRTQNIRCRIPALYIEMNLSNFCLNNFLQSPAPFIHSPAKVRQFLIPSPPSAVTSPTPIFLPPISWPSIALEAEESPPSIYHSADFLSRHRNRHFRCTLRSRQSVTAVERVIGPAAPAWRGREWGMKRWQHRTHSPITASNVALNGDTSRY